MSTHTTTHTTCHHHRAHPREATGVRRRSWVDDQAFRRAVSFLLERVPRGEYEFSVFAPIDPPARGGRMAVDGIAGCLDVLKTSSFETRRPKNDVRDNEEVQERLWPKEMRVLRQEDENRRRHREFVVKGEGQLDADQLSHIK